jgi:hypothetical protein
MRTNWRDFGIGMAAGIALCFVLYFGWGLLRPRHSEPVGNVAATSNAPVGMDENALIAANAERPPSNQMTPPPQLRPEPRNEVRPVPDDELLPAPPPRPPVVRPRPRPEPDDEPQPEDVEPDDDGGKPND